jgi:hypothetical protein
MDWVEALKARCLLAVMEPDSEALLRRIFRWYSKTFATPLHLVRNLPVEDILVAYFEHSFEEMEPPQLQEHLAELTDTEEDRELKKRQQDADEEFYRQALEEAKKDQAKEDAKPQIQAPPAMTESRLPEPKVEPLPDINMKFDEQALDNFIESDPIGAPPPGRKRQS